MRLKEVKKYLALYNQEDYLFNFLGPQIRKRGFLTFEDLYKICMWKSVRQKQQYLKNKKSVEKITKLAFTQTDEILKIKTLCSLKGVAIPTASAILTITYPNKYAIIDIRCLEMLGNLKFDINTPMTTNNWLKYLDIVRKMAKENNLTPREVDKVLFSMHKESLESNSYQNLYK